MPARDDVDSIIRVTPPDVLARHVSANPAFAACVDYQLANAQEQKLAAQLLGADFAARAPPSSWATTASSTVVDVAPLSSDPAAADEFASVTSLFARRGGRTKTVQEVYRLRNMELWYKYSGSLNAIEARCGQTPNVKLLWHGTAHPEPCRTIARQGFDPRLAPVHGRVYGDGTYFARDVGYSDHYARPDQRLGGTKHMFLSSVCVGSPCVGRPGMRRPDPMPDGSLHDSAVDQIDNPTITVIFEPGGSLALPLYVIAYTDGVFASMPVMQSAAELQTDVELAAVAMHLIQDTAAFSSLRRLPQVRGRLAHLPVPDPAASNGTLIAPTALVRRALEGSTFRRHKPFRFGGVVLEATDPLATAVHACNVSAIEALLGGAGRALDVSVLAQSANADAWPLLATAAEADVRVGGPPRLLALLLRHGAPPNHRSPSGRTALHVCAERGWGAHAEVLLWGGADPLIRVGSGDGAGALPAQLALTAGHSELAGRLQAATDAAEAPLVERIRAAYARVRHFSFDSLLENDPAVELPFEERYCATYGQDKSIEEAEAEIAEFFRFMAIKAVHCEVTPSVAVDNVLHLALAYSHSYEYLCARLCGEFVHHEPTAGGAAANQRYRRQYEDTLALYELAYREPPPPSVWPAIEARFNPDNDFVSLSRAHLQKLASGSATTITRLTPAVHILGCG